MASCNVDFDCPRCGKRHEVCGGLIENGPDRTGTIAELYEGRELPGVLVSLMTDTPWCDEVGEYAPMDDPARYLEAVLGGHYVTPSMWLRGNQ